MKKNIFTVDEILCRKKASDAPFSTKMILSDHPTIYSRLCFWQSMPSDNPCSLVVFALPQSSLSGNP